MKFITSYFVFTSLACFIGVKNLYGQMSDYFPMQIGNKCTYELWTGGFPGGIHWGDKIIEIIDTTMINQKKYFVFNEIVLDHFYNPGQRLQNTHYFRKASNGDIMKFSDCINDEQLFYTFQVDSLNRPYLFCGDLPKPQKWQITFIDTALIVTIPLGVFPNSYDYFFDVLIDGNLLPVSIRRLAPNIGFIEEIAEGDDNFLSGAYVNGILFGDTTVTSVQQIPALQVPLLPKLYQNYPNPFNGLTHIPYSVPDFWTQPIKISIINIRGQEILTFMEKNFKSGHFEVQWDGTDYSGRTVSSGIYFVRLVSGHFHQIIKINFLK